MSKSETNETDFSAFFLDDTSVCELTDPTGEPLLFNGSPVRVHVFGPSTTQHQKASDRLQKEATKRVLAQMSKKGKKDEPDPDADVKFLIAITDRFENFPYPSGVEGIYREPKLSYIKEQVQAFVGDMGNFYKTGAKT